MKMRFLVLALLLPAILRAQEPCRVLLPELDSVYVGKCKNGLAHGQGEAWGAFHYKGKFAEGYPHGVGTAEYKDGTVYEGQWSKGLRHGKGKLRYKENGQEVEKTWIWEQGNRQKEIVPPPYKIITQRNVNRMKVYRQAAGNQVWFFPNSMGGVASDIQDIQLAGNSGSETQLGQKIGYVDVTYPFKGSLRYKTWNKLRTTQFDVVVEIEVFESGIWIIEIQN